MANVIIRCYLDNNEDGEDAKPGRFGDYFEFKEGQEVTLTFQRKPDYEVVLEVKLNHLGNVSFHRRGAEARER